jgi:hypothetical protein
MTEKMEKEEKRKQKYIEYLKKAQLALAKSREYGRKAQTLENKSLEHRKNRNHILILIGAHLLYLAYQKQNIASMNAIEEILSYLRENQNIEYDSVIELLDKQKTKQKETST